MYNIAKKMEDILLNSVFINIPSLQIVSNFTLDAVFQKEKNKTVKQYLFLGIIGSLVLLIFQLVHKEA